MLKINYKVGDKVRRINGRNCNMQEGDTGIVTSIGTNTVDVRADNDGIIADHDSGNMVLVEKINTTKNMNLIEKAKLAFKGEPQKSFITAGVMDSNENFTTEGRELFLTYLLNKNGDDFKTTVIDPILAADAKK